MQSDNKTIGSCEKLCPELSQKSDSKVPSIDLDALYRLFREDVESIIRYYDVCPYDADDIKQEFWIKVDAALKNGKAKYIVRDGLINKPYLFSILRNLIFDTGKKKASMQTVELIENELPEVEIEPTKNIDEELYKAIGKIEYWFDRKLILHYVVEGHTIRSLSKATHISTTTIFHSLKRSKLFIKKELEK